jgi:hypothetical protein
LQRSPDVHEGQGLGGCVGTSLVGTERRDQARRVVRDPDGIAVRILDSRQPIIACASELVGLLETAVAICPSPVRAVKAQRVILARPVSADIAAAVVEIGRLIAVGVDALEAAARCIRGTNQSADAPVVAKTPAIVVVTVPATLAVVGAQQIDVWAGTRKVLVSRLNDQVAVGRVDGDLLACAPPSTSLEVFTNPPPPPVTTETMPLTFEKRCGSAVIQPAASGFSSVTFYYIT